METRRESLSPNKNEKLRMDIKINYLNQLSDRVLYDLDPKNSIKLDRNGLIRHLAETRDLDDIHLDIVTNPDIYDTSYVDQLYRESVNEMKRLGIDKKVKNKKEEEMEENWEKEWEKDQRIYSIFDDTLMLMQMTKGRKPMSEEELDQLVDEYMQSREKEETKQRSQKRLEKMVQEFEEEKESKWAEEYAKEQSDKWVKEYDKSILDFFISPSERQVIKQMIQKLIPEQKKMVVDMVMQSKAVLKMKPEEQRKYVAEFIRNLAKQSGRPSKY